MAALLPLPKVNPLHTLRRRNSSTERLRKAIDFYEEFHWGDKAKTTTKRKLSPRMKTGVKLGKMHAVAYETTKNGETAVWEHEFGEDGGKQPDLVMDVDTKKLHVVGGTYDVEGRGIVD